MRWPCIVSFILLCFALFCLFIYFGFKRSNVISSFIIIAYYFKVGNEIRVRWSTHLLWAVRTYKKAPLFRWQQHWWRWHSFISTSFIEFDASLFTRKSQAKPNSIRCAQRAAIFPLFRYCAHCVHLAKEMSLFSCYRCYWNTTRAYGIL